MTDKRLFSPSAQRNREPILQVLRHHLPHRGKVLELGSGSGEHAVYFAAALPELLWQPSEMDTDALESIQAWIATTGLANVLSPLRLDVNHRPWPVEQFDAIVSVNVIHYSPWESTLSLLEGAARHLPEGGVLYFYGPFMRGGRHTAPSNAEFDEWLKQRDPRFGVRSLETLQQEAQARGFETAAILPMPANNFSVIMKRTVA